MLLEQRKKQKRRKNISQNWKQTLCRIDGLIGFASSDAGIKYFGEDTAKGIVAHGKEIKAAGAKYCDCPACAAVAAILEKKEDMLK